MLLTESVTFSMGPRTSCRVPSQNRSQCPTQRWLDNSTGSLQRQSTQECVLADLPSRRGYQMGETWKRRFGQRVNLYVRLNSILFPWLLATTLIDSPNPCSHSNEDFGIRKLRGWLISKSAYWNSFFISLIALH